MEELKEEGEIIPKKKTQTPAFKMIQNQQNLKSLGNPLLFR